MILHIIGWVIISLVVLGVLSFPVFAHGWKTGVLIDLSVLAFVALIVFASWAIAS